MRSAIVRLSAMCVLAAALASCSVYKQPAENPAGPTSANTPAAENLLPFGNPSNAGRNDRDNYLLVKSSFAISYNDRRGTANWVVWRTTAGDLGESVPRPDFEPDPDLPTTFRAVNPGIYSGSGYDRGHLCPSADRFARPDLNAETFYTTNIAPQAKGLNQYPWEKLERYARAIARRSSDVYQIAGVYGDQGRLKNRLTVPTNWWKIVVVLPPGSNEVTARTRVIAVDMPNTDAVANDDWRKYVTTVRAIEQKTGYNFLSALPQAVQDAVETRPDALRPNASR